MTLLRNLMSRIDKQQQQVYFKLNIAYKACARNERRLFEAARIYLVRVTSINL